MPIFGVFCSFHHPDGTNWTSPSWAHADNPRKILLEDAPESASTWQMPISRIIYHNFLWIFCFFCVRDKKIQVSFVKKHHLGPKLQGSARKNPMYRFENSSGLLVWVFVVFFLKKTCFVQNSEASSIISKRFFMFYSLLFFNFFRRTI